jgi:hypothetical protein
VSTTGGDGQLLTAAMEMTVGDALGEGAAGPSRRTRARRAVRWGKGTRLFAAFAVLAVIAGFLGSSALMPPTSGAWADRTHEEWASPGNDAHVGDVRMVRDREARHRSQEG